MQAISLNTSEFLVAIMPEPRARAPKRVSAVCQKDSGREWHN